MNTEKAYASDRVVLLSIPSDIWYKRVYLIADKKSWMDYENFTVQIGDRGEFVYNFPDWYHGKYEPALYNEDISGDSLEDVIIVLNNDKAGIGNPLRDIHILNQIRDPYQKYVEAPVEPINLITDRLVKIEQHGNLVRILADNKKYEIDISKYDFSNPRDPYVSIDTIEYSIENGTLIGIVNVYVVRDDSVYGGYLGHLKIDYFWAGQMYKAKSITFKEHEPEKN
ncbi:hypothetical protein [Psychrobacillus vulpis]|uniref:Uncharacterized protein n=1 Tax=Psychrobacillus vulpis TaxID=2325572 RepID=A0A544TPM7_9BACI|nr:hypothetical protein [Psychrobacillus vulpis]TQR19417.1 hypothetical protein FG384_12255 [Psychrobacillus vulpis]